MIDRRREERVQAAMPVFLEALSGATCNVSASGMFIEVSGLFFVGTAINFAVEFKAPNGRMMLRCWAEVIRIEQRENGLGIGLRIVDSSLGLAGYSNFCNADVLSSAAMAI